jgi:hypothetical protein
MPSAMSGAPVIFTGNMLLSRRKKISSPDR